MKEENRKIELTLGNVSWNSFLGNYYIDLTKAKIHYSTEYYGNFWDEDGLPHFEKKGIKYYSPINLAQYGFILISEYYLLQTKEKFIEIEKCVHKILELKTETENGTIWYNDFDDEKYGLKAPWASAMAQGEIISLLLRYYELSKNEMILKVCNNAYNYLLVSVENGGVAHYNIEGEIWLEEYPLTPPLKVLNGYIYALFGIIDLYRITKREDIYTIIKNCYHTIKNNIHHYDTGYWTYYALNHKELVRIYYQRNVHVPQLEILGILFEDQEFIKLSKKWKKQINFFNILFVKIMYRVLPRWNKFRKIWNQ